MTQPISAPPANAYEGEDAFAPEQEEAYSNAQTHRDPYLQVTSAAVPAPFVQQVMFIRDRTDWKHYYFMPASVGIQNIPRLLDELLREGVQLEHIEVTFENQETKR